MYAVLALVIHATVSSLAALAIAPYSIDPAATAQSLWTLGMASALLSLIVYLAILAPTLVAVLLASLLERPKSGWQA